MSFKKSATLLVAVTAVTLIASCTPEKPEGNTVAKVNRASITDKQVDTRLANLPQNIKGSFANENGKKILLDQMVNEELLHQQAKRSGYEKNDAFKDQVKGFEKQFEDAKKQALINLIVRDNIDSKIKITQEEVSSYYNNNPKQFEAFEQRRAKHILVETKQEAQKLLNRIKLKKATFDAVAKKYSKDPTAENSGDLGWFKKGDLVPEFEKAVYALRKNQLSQVVKTDFGFHIIKLTDTKKVAKRELKDVQQQIQQAIYNQKRNAALNEYLKTLKQNHKVTYTEAKPAEAPAAK